MFFPINFFAAGFRTEQSYLKLILVFCDVERDLCSFTVESVPCKLTGLYKHRRRGMLSCMKWEIAEWWGWKLLIWNSGRLTRAAIRDWCPSQGFHPGPKSFSFFGLKFLTVSSTTPTPPFFFKKQKPAFPQQLHYCQGQQHHQTKSTKKWPGITVKSCNWECLTPEVLCLLQRGQWETLWQWRWHCLLRS